MSFRIIPYEDQYQQIFAQLNYDWIQKYFSIEDIDREYLDHPRQKIIAAGGIILLAQSDKNIVGTVALVKMSKTRYELAKMCVDPAYHRRGIARALTIASIEQAKSIPGAEDIYLETNSILAPAIKLYYDVGFKDVTGLPTPYTRCDVQMILKL